MQYISPFYLLEAVDARYDAKGLLLARKKILAELELNGGQRITIRGRELDKNDIIKFFEELQPHGNLAWHLAIAEDPVLLKFLEENVLEKGARFRRNFLYTDERFVNWVSLYYFTSFTSFAELCLNAHDDVEWETLLANPLLMNLYYQEDAWMMIEQNVGRGLKKLEAIADSEAACKTHLKNVHFTDTLTGYTYTKMLQALPAERFTRFRDEYAEAMVRCAIYIFNKLKHERAFPLLKDALLLAVSTELKKRIESTQVEMFLMQRRWEKGRSDRLAKRCAIALLIIFIIYAFITGNRDDAGTNGYNYNHPRTHDNIPRTLRQIDSTLALPANMNAGDSIPAHTNAVKHKK